MNFSPFTTQFGAIPANTVNQFAAAKLVQNITTANGQVVGLVSNGEFIRPLENGTQFSTNTGQNNATATLASAQNYITLPITMPGAKPGDAQQTVHIQILNPNPPPIQQPQPKFQLGQMQIPIQNFHQDTTVLTVAYSPQEGEILQNNLGEAMTIVAAIQPQDLPLLAQVQQQQQLQQQALQQQLFQTQNALVNSINVAKENEKNEIEQNSQIINIKAEPTWDSETQTTNDLSEYFTRLPQNLNQYLKFNHDTTTKTNFQTEENSTNSGSMDGSYSETIVPDVIIKTEDGGDTEKVENENEKTKKKRKYKTKPPKPKKPRPGQVHIATALDGTALYCCPECQMAYPEKENLEQHLTVHKIERRFICDICGAGLKRKEHLERHKSGHNPDRPYTCSVCMKGFKRKEHLNLHFVIHSGAKTEICGECGKGFYRKDHLRKHTKSHATRRLKEEMANAAAKLAANTSTASNSASTSTNLENNNLSTTTIQDGSGIDPLLIKREIMESNLSQTVPQSTTICLPEVTIHVPTSDNQTLPVQIQIPQLVTTSSADGTTSTVVLSPQNMPQTQ